jgi:tripartite-type tricarboxylate transporter receptor subunit TctC
MPPFRKFALAILLPLATWSAHAQGSAKPIRFILPYPAGTGVDVVARQLGNELGPLLGTTVIVDNRPGGSGQVAVNEFKRSAPDGQTLLLATNEQLVVNRVVFKQLSYDVEKDMRPFAGIYQSTFVVAASAASGIKSARDIIEASRRKPEKLSYATLGKGSLGHVSGELFSVSSGISMLHVPFNNLGALNSAVGNGDVDLTFLTMASIDPIVKSGKAVAVASLSSDRQAHYPNVPTLVEAGGNPMFAFRGWLAAVALTGTPKAVEDKLQQAITRAVASDAFKARLATLGFDPWPATGSAIQKLMAEELRQVRDIAARPGMQLE